MSVSLENIVPFGRSLREYELMFNLSARDLQSKMLDCGGGPASFNAEMTGLGYSVISIDPIYQFSGAQIEQRFLETVDDVIAQINATPNDWIWYYHRNSEDLRRNRVEAMQRFLQDYQLGRATNRYRIASLPTLPFPDHEFDLALCSHLLFLYSDLLSLEFHLNSILELCRVAREVRIFPLLTLAIKRSPYIDSLRQHLDHLGITTAIETVQYELQKGGNEMMRIFRR
jgi:SAM-dependent methyltransferase